MVPCLHVVAPCRLAHACATICQQAPEGSCPVTLLRHISHQSTTALQAECSGSCLWHGLPGQDTHPGLVPACTSDIVLAPSLARAGLWDQQLRFPHWRERQVGHHQVHQGRWRPQILHPSAEGLRCCRVYPEPRSVAPQDAVASRHTSGEAGKPQPPCLHSS